MANIVKLNYTAEEIDEKLGKIDDVVQTIGNSETAVMSQKAVTGEINKVNEVIGLPCVLASGTVDAVAPAYTHRVIGSGISLKKGTTYTIKGKVTTEATAFVVYAALYKDGEFWKFALINEGTTDYTATTTFVADADYDNISFEMSTGITSGLSLTASLETVPLETLAEKVDCIVPISFNPNTFVNGDAQFWDGGKKIDITQTHRVCSGQTNFHKYPQAICLKVLDGFRFAVGYYTDGVYTSESSWQTELTIPANQQFRISISRTTEDTSEVADIAEFVSKVVILAEGLKEILYPAETESTDTISFCPDTNFNPNTFVNGDAQFWYKGGLVISEAGYRVCNPPEVFFQYPTDIHLKASNGFRFIVGYYTDKAYTSDSDFVTEADISANQQFKLMICRKIENTEETVDVAEFVSKVLILSKGHEELFSEVNDALDDLKLSAPIKPFEVLSINHRGYNKVAPENTLPAFKLSKKNGFDFVECDVRFTSDGVPVLLHDASINRTARNADGTTIAETINIADITYETALNYDFGIYMGEEYAGVKIPTFAEFMKLCRALSLHPYLDVYDIASDEKCQAIFDIIKGCGMEHNVTIVSSVYDAKSSSFEYIVKVLPYARYGIVAFWEQPTQGLNPSGMVDRLKDMGIKDIFISMALTPCDHSAYIEMCKTKGVALEVYSPDTEEQILNLDPFISGVTSDTLVAKDVLREAYLD